MATPINFSPTEYPISPEAHEALKKESKFTAYFTPEEWIECRAGFEKRMRPLSEEARSELLSNVTHKQIAHHPVVEITPKTYRNATKLILYFHGGAYTVGGPAFHLHIYAPLSHLTGWKAIGVDYPLAPYESTENSPFPAHMAGLEVYEELLKTYKASDIIFFGDSAGGGLIFGLTLLLIEKKLPLPRALLTYAPWVDLEQKTPSYSNQQVIDQAVILAPENLRSARDAAFPKDYTSPIASAINANPSDLAQFPPVMICTAGRDLLCKEGELLAKKLKDSGVDTYYTCAPGMWHVYQEYWKLPESKKCIEAAAQFLLKL